MATVSKKGLRREILLLILLCAVCLAGVVYLIVRYVRPFSDDKVGETTAAETAKTEDTVKKLVTGFYFDDSTSFTYHSARQTGPLSFTYDGSVWHWDGDGDFPVNSNMIYAMIYTLTNMTPTRTFDAAQVDEEAFGLTDPSACATVCYRVYNGKASEFEFLFGIRNETLQATYVKCTEKGGTPLYGMVSEDAAQMLSYTFLETADAASLPDFSALNITSVEVNAPDSAEPAVFEAASEAAKAISAVKLLKICDFKPDEEASVLYGLDAAHAIGVTVHYDEMLEVSGADGSSYLLNVPKQLTLTVGVQVPGDASQCFFTVDGTYLVYQISSAFLQAIAS